MSVLTHIGKDFKTMSMVIKSGIKKCSIVQIIIMQKFKGKVHGFQVCKVTIEMIDK